MTPLMIVISIILIVAAAFLTIAILLQHGKSHNLSGTIAGASETFFGKSKATTIDRKLSTLTTVVAIVFVLLVLASFLLQGLDTSNTNTTDGTTAATSTVTDTATDSDTAADSDTATATDSETPAESESEPVESEDSTAE